MSQMSSTQSSDTDREWQTTQEGGEMKQGGRNSDHYLIQSHLTIGISSNYPIHLLKRFYPISLNYLSTFSWPA